MSEARCPRCGGSLGDRPARSRLAVDREVLVCTACGQDEAVRQATGRTSIPFGEWPSSR